jgi:class I lanthipeptide synthase
MWRPIANGDLAPRLEVVRAEIMDAVISGSATNRADPWTALLFAYADRAAGSQVCEQLVESTLAAAADLIGQATLTPGLYGGFSGVAWLLAHLDPDVQHDEIEDALAILLAKRPWRGMYDLVSGLVGIGVYLLERAATSSRARDCLELVVAHLADLAVASDEGVAWFTPPHHLPHWQRELAPNGFYNVGVAHGIPGVIAFLGQVCETNIASPVAHELLVSAVRWLLAQRGKPALPGSIQGRRRRAAWCYGDLGCAAALLRAARCAREPSWETDALELARGVVRHAAISSVTHTGLCHGTAGNAHLLNRLYQATGETMFLDAARTWLEATLDRQQPGVGVAGYSTSGPSGFEEAAGFLEGASGVALALLAAASDVEPAWDRLLLVSIPPLALPRA